MGVTEKAIADQGKNLWLNAYMHIIEIDKLIHKADEQLEILQPPSPGRLRVHWEKCRSEDLPFKCPTMVRWSKFRTGIWHFDRVSMDRLARRAKTTGWFFHGSNQTKEVLGVLSKLFTLRASSVSTLTAARKAIAEAPRQHEAALLRANGVFKGVDMNIASQGGCLPWRKAMPEALPQKFQDGNLDAT